MYRADQLFLTGPAISNFGTPTEGISEFVDFHLQPIIKSLPHIVKDTTDFLCQWTLNPMQKPQCIKVV